MKEFNTIADVVKWWRYAEVRSIKLFPLYMLVEYTQRECLVKEVTFKSRTRHEFTYSDAWWKSSGHKSALGRFRRLLAPLVNKPEYHC